MLVVAAVKYRPPRDDLVDLRVAQMRGVVWATTTDLVSEGVDACGTVVIAALGQVEMAIDDLAEEREADLVAVTSERPSGCGCSRDRGSRTTYCERSGGR